MVSPNQILSAAGFLLLSYLVFDFCCSLVFEKEKVVVSL